ncbi:glutathione S-transferase C-terminal domain-containing protein homolog [Neocloeon triangulifer]|uniref:glutathione S-transferase C-terminal domain-containing protein homolog n=1 Tax=Neocloeon triangulifer TaxID=2078957 RepID=UPI00286EE28D|nr:glutathione S-transferase C-terminal domain-containing protein homolog [Neocloeon triangulifer]
MKNMDCLYLEIYSDPILGGKVTVPLQTLISLFILDFVKSPAVELRLIPSAASEKQGFQARLRHPFKVTKLEDAPTCAKNCILPVVEVGADKTCVAGLCAVLRQVVKSTLKEHPGHFSRALLGFREGCLMACAEASTWTRFCEVDIIAATQQTLKVPCFHSPVTFPRDLVRFEHHMSQPLRIHNVRKVRQDHAKVADSELDHCFAEGPSLTLADMIILPCVHMLLSFVDSVYLKEHLPLVRKWLGLMRQQPGVEDALEQVVVRPQSKVLDSMFVQYIVPEVPNQSLYKSDPRRYKSKARTFTRQDELDESLLKVPVAPEYESNPFGFDVSFDWEAVPQEANPQGGQLLESRLERKGQQLENLAKAALKLAQNGDVIVDFCSGAGHLGIILAHFLPRCTVILLENKEESLKRARLRVNKLNLSNVTFYQCNLDYFKGPFDIGVSLHACGVATDLVIQRCIHQGACFVSCPCCYGSVQDNHQLSYPRSSLFQNTTLTLRDYLVIGHSADQTHDEHNHKTNQGKKCMAIIDTDRCTQAKEAGYRVHMSRLVPETCTPKNNLLVGVPKERHFLM